MHMPSLRQKHPDQSIQTVPLFSHVRNRWPGFQNQYSNQVTDSMDASISLPEPFDPVPKAYLPDPSNSLY